MIGIRTMDKLPVEWVAKIFNYLDDFFKEAWRQLYPEDRINIAICQWQSGLLGVTPDQIKKALAISKCMAKDGLQPPNVMDFYLYAKGLKLPPKAPIKLNVQIDRGLARNAIDIMKKRARGYASP